jgi:hypothetical protein
MMTPEEEMIGGLKIAAGAGLFIALAATVLVLSSVLAG